MGLPYQRAIGIGLTGAAILTIVAQLASNTSILIDDESDRIPGALFLCITTTIAATGLALVARSLE
jgi:hypothetical protein